MMNMNDGSQLCAFSTIFLCLAGISQAQTITIADHGNAEVDIVLAADASIPAHHAADELASFLNQVTGAVFTINHDINHNQAHILIGENAAKLADPTFSTNGLGKDGMIIRTLGSNLILAGTEPRGTLYAVYSFLEDEVGCRWWTSTESTIPVKPTLTVSNLNINYTPPLEYRESFWFDAFDGDWGVRNKCNGNAFRLDEAHGGKISYIGFVHTAYQLIPPKKYFKDHPEWFSLIDGKRTYENGQLCLTNEAMRRELVKNLKALLRAHPEAKITSVSQNDNHHPCQCDACKAIDAEEGSPSGTLLRFVNKVAADIEDEFPDVSVSTLAYQYTRHPPKITRPRRNVIIRLCSIECSFVKPLTDDRNKSFRDDIVGWSNIADRLYIWDYVTNFRHYLIPHPNLRVLGPNIRFFTDHHARGILEQGGYTSPGTEMAALRAWVIAKLLWNPTLNDKDLINEFLNGYYGKAADPIRIYLDNLHDSAESVGDFVGFYDRASKINVLSLPLLTKSLNLFKQAEEAVADQPEIHKRVLIAELPVVYSFLVRWDILKKQAADSNLPWPVDNDIKAVHQRFLMLASLAGVTRIGESYGLDSLQKEVDEIANR